MEAALPPSGTELAPSPGRVFHFWGGGGGCVGVRWGCGGGGRAGGVVVRHGRSCACGGGGGCDCEPGFQAQVFVPRDGRTVRKTFRSLAEARAWRAETSVA